jgi:hypothetical protein
MTTTTLTIPPIDLTEADEFALLDLAPAGRLSIGPGRLHQGVVGPLEGRGRLERDRQDLIEAVRCMQDVPGVDRRDLDDARTRLRCNLGADEDMLTRAGTVLATAAGSLASLG